MAIRTTAVWVHVLWSTTTLPEVRVAEVSAEVMRTGEPDARVTSIISEVIAQPAGEVSCPGGGGALSWGYIMGVP